MIRKMILKDEAGQLDELSRIEFQLYKSGYYRIVGVDEVGRGPLAGPVVAAAVCLPPDLEISGIDDSKKLSATQREDIFDQIVSSSAIYAIGIVDHEVIDRINILRASLRAMGEAVCKMDCQPEIILVDGRETIPSLNIPQVAVVGGDARCRSIAAASIIAKVTRDRIMERYDNLYPGFSFSRHKGYPTSDHLKELGSCGPTPIHRRSFRPVQQVISQKSVSQRELTLNP